MSSVPKVELRHARQAKLAEVGAEGQARIAAADATIRLGGLAGVVAARYLAGAGVRALVVAEPGAAAAAREVDARVSVRVELCEGADDPSFEDLDPAARQVAQGAYAALAVLRNAACALPAPVGRTVVAVAFALGLVTLAASPARADVRQLATTLAERHRAAGAVVVVLPPRFAFDGDVFAVSLPAPTMDAKCTSIALIGARGLGFHVTLGDDAGANKVASAAGALEIALCGQGQAWQALRVHIDAGRGAFESVVSRSADPLVSMREVLPERTPATGVAAADPGPVPALPPLPERVEAAEARARADGAEAVLKVARAADGDGAGELSAWFDAGCYRLDVVGAEAASRRRGRTDIDAELLDGRDDSVVARDRGDAADARLEVCVGTKTPLIVRFIGAAPGEPVIVSRASWPTVSVLPREWSAVTRARALSVLKAHRVSIVESPSLVLIGGGGVTPLSVEVEPGACYLALAVVSQGQSRGLRLAARVGAMQWSEERAPEDAAALVSFCTREQRSAQLDVDARGSSLAWTFALVRVNAAVWSP